ncbi:MAG TPA: diadenylate cyclase CdaA [Candidatus Polarisedimenticolia bacterium]|nr:diadenylate cyclase CdaA [Candidatus Polarisedimenticolia bacterium]
MIESFFTHTGGYAFGWRDLLDILLMTVLIYQVGLLIKGTRALQTLLGVLLVVLAYYVTGPDRLLYLRSLHRVLGSVLFYAPFAIIVLFQTTIRRALAHLGRTSFLRTAEQEMTDRMLDDIVRAATDLLARPTGALIVIEREQALPDQIESGSQLDAAISHDLLMNIFTPGSLLHDGAAIIGDGRVKAAACFLPVTADPRLSREHGSRHRAAIGLTEEYDSLVIVVSEERGEIRVAVEGQLHGPMDGPALKAFLRRHLGAERHSFKDEPRPVRRTTDAA